MEGAAAMVAGRTERQKDRIIADFSAELETGGRVCGIDEAGRGPWAGPVVAAAVLLNPADIPEGLADSKTLKKQKREELAREIHARAAVGIGISSVKEIDQMNILAASLLAMQRAFDALNESQITPIDAALVDGNRLPELSCRTKCIIKGDAKSLSIAAASIAAKVKRDEIMQSLALQYPGYGWERNAGYGTKEHQNALAALGVSMHHRRSFRPVKLLLESAVSR